MASCSCIENMSRLAQIRDGTIRPVQDSELKQKGQSNKEIRASEVRGDAASRAKWVANPIKLPSIILFVK
jgi:hypothetical protein